MPLPGKRVVELGAGIGMVGLALAALGAEATMTDKAALLSLMRGNVARNWLAGTPRPGAQQEQAAGRADVVALQWGAPGFMDVVRQLADRRPVDWVVATDCTYPDPDGPDPNTVQFMEACAGLCSPKTMCLVTFEARGEDLKAIFSLAAQRHFRHVKQLPREELPQKFRRRGYIQEPKPECKLGIETGSTQQAGASQQPCLRVQLLLVLAHGQEQLLLLLVAGSMDVAQSGVSGRHLLLQLRHLQPEEDFQLLGMRWHRV
eukprot:jgi/Astpho2/109/Aster-x0894